MPTSAGGAALKVAELDDEDLQVLMPLLGGGIVQNWFSITAVGESDAVSLWNEAQDIIERQGDVRASRIHVAMDVLVGQFNRGAVLFSEGGFGRVYRLDASKSLKEIMEAEMAEFWDQAPGFIVYWEK